MSKIEPTIVLTKFDFMNEYLDRLERFKSISLEEYLADIDTQLIVERLLQLTFQVGIDVNRHLLKGLEVEQPETNFETFVAVSQCGIITVELATELGKSASLRNRLVHLYEEIDPVQVHSAIRNALDKYPIYQRQVTEYLDYLEVGNDKKN